MNPVVFSSPEEFLNFFESNDKLYLMPGEKLVIKKIDSILTKGVWDPGLPTFLQLDPGLCFLNRIILPLGKCLEKDDTDGTKLDFDIDGYRAKLSKETVTVLHLRRGRISTTINGLFMRMLQSNKLTFSLEPEQRFYVICPPDVPYNRNLNGNDSLRGILKYHLSGGCALDYLVQGSLIHGEIGVGGGHYFDIDRPSKCTFHLSHTYTYANPDILGKMISLQNGFTLPAGETLKVSGVKNLLFIPLLSNSKPSTRDSGLLTFFNQCLVFYGLSVKNLSSNGKMRWSFNDENTFELTFTQPLSVEVKEATELAFEVRSFANEMRVINPSLRTLTLNPDNKLVFLLTHRENLVLDPLYERHRLGQCTVNELLEGVIAYIFSSFQDTIGLTWRTALNDVSISRGVSALVDMPMITIQGTGTVGVIAELGANMIVKIIRKSPKETRAAFFNMDPEINKYLLFRVFFEIFCGELFGYSEEDLTRLCLKQDVIKKITEIKRDGEFYLAYRMIIEKHRDEAIQLQVLNHEEIDKIAVDSYSAPVQKLLRAITEVIGLELQNSDFLTRHCHAALVHLEKEAQSL